MDENRARSLLLAERTEVSGLLSQLTEAGREDRAAENEKGVDYADAATPLTQQGMDDAIADGMRARIETLDRALRRLDEGTYGRSIHSGVAIPEERLEADPAAELTIEEARIRETR